MRELFGFLADFLAQMSRTDSDFKHSYNLDDSEFNCNPDYVINTTIKHVK